MSLTLAEARARANEVTEVSYRLHLDLTEPTSGHFGSRTEVEFVASAPETFLELADATDLAVQVDGVRVDPAYDGQRIALSGLSTDGLATEVVVAARLPYVTHGDGMHTFTDPADGETYVSAYCGMDIAHRVLACFDQNDLKASLSLTVTADPGWSVLGNGRATSLGAGRWTFSTMPTMPVALFVVCAGPWRSVTWEHDGLPCGWHARRSLAAELQRDAPELRATTDGVLDHYAEIFTEPYPFDSCDQVFVPGLNWGAQENPGCVTYRDEMLPRERITDDLRTFRATVIAHEQAHMWFGNLVTMRWFEDTWLQESFADYFGYRVAEDGAGFADALVPHEIGRKPAAYVADERRSTHPVAPLAEDVPDVNAALTNFDSISYAKGSSVLRQLVTWLGDEAFLAGVNDHLTRHRFGNATLEDFVASLDGASDRDVREWVRVWLRTSGFDTVRVARDGDVPVLSREGIRPHRFTVTAYDDRLRPVDSRLVDLGDEPVRLDEWSGAVVVPNGGGETFARVRLDELSWAAVSGHLADVEDPLTRTVLWATAFDLTETGDLDADGFVDLVAAHLPREQHATLVRNVLQHATGRLLPLRVPAGDAAAVVDRLADACRAGLSAAPEEQVAVALTHGLAATSRDAALLHGWLDAGRTETGVALDPGMRWRVMHRLAEIGAADEAVVEAERGRDGSAEADLGAARALAARPTPEAKAAAWDALADDETVSNRMVSALARGLWSPEQTGLVAPYVAAYLERAPGMARRSAAFANVVGWSFPAVALDPAQLELLREALRGDVPTVLRRAWEDELDDRA
jgi:aminopeptidase N